MKKSTSAAIKSPRPVRVTLLAPDLFAHNRRSALMAETLAAAGHTVTVYTCRDAESLEIPGVELRATLAPDIDQNPKAALPKPADLKREDVVQVTGRGALRVTPMLSDHTRLIYDSPGALASPEQEDGGWKERGRALLDETRLSFGERHYARRFNAVLCIGYLFGEFLQRELKLERVPVVPIYAAPPYQANLSPTPLEIPAEQPAVVVADIPYEELEIAIHAIGRLRKVNLAVVNGRGDWSVCERWAAECGMSTRLHRVEADPARLVDTLAAFDMALLLPADTSQRARHDIPDVLFSFLMAGLPVVASHLPGIERIVSGHSLGAMTDPENEVEVADQVARTCLEKPVLARLRHNVGVVREKRYSWEVQATRLCTLYDHLLGRESIEKSAG